MTERGFRDPQALRRSITDRPRAAAAAEPHAALADLLRQFAYDRLLPVLSGVAVGRWDPQALAWTANARR